MIKFEKQIYLVKIILSVMIGISLEILATQICFRTLPLRVHSGCCSGVQYCLTERRHLFLEPLPLLSLLKLNIHIVGCRFKAVQYNMILQIWLQLPGQILNQSVNLQKTPPYLALAGELWGVFCDNFQENWPRYNGTTLNSSLMMITHSGFIDTNWAKVCRWHFQMHFLESNLTNLDLNFTDVCLQAMI